MPYASLRNAIPRKTNKERAQPSGRKKHGLLEKHKDYILRARDYQKKTKTIAHLKSKAAFKNPDEFYNAMTSSKTKGGVHTLTHEDASLPHGHIQLLKTQDMAYINMKRALDDKKADKLKSNLHFLLDTPTNTHTVFVDSAEEAQSFDPSSHFETVPALAGRAYNRPRKETLEAEHSVLGVSKVPQLKKLRKEREKAYKELGQRLDRSDKMRKVLDRMQVEKNVMGKGRKRKVQDAEDGKPPVYKWKRERRK